MIGLLDIKLRETTIEHQTIACVFVVTLSPLVMILIGDSAFVKSAATETVESETEADLASLQKEIDEVRPII